MLSISYSTVPVNNHLVVLIWNLSTCQSANRNLQFRRPGGRSKDSFLCRMKRRSDTCHPFEERRSVSRVICVRTWSLFTRFHVSTTKWYLRRRPYINVRATGRNSGTYLFSLAVRIKSKIPLITKQKLISYYKNLNRFYYIILLLVTIYFISHRRWRRLLPVFYFLLFLQQMCSGLRLLP